MSIVEARHTYIDQRRAVPLDDEATRKNIGLVERLTRDGTKD